MEFQIFLVNLTPLAKAAKYGNLEVVNYLLTIDNIDINAQTIYRYIFNTIFSEIFILLHLI